MEKRLKTEAELIAEAAEEADTRSFEKSLRRLGIGDSWDILIKKGIQRGMLKAWLRDIAGSPDKYGSETIDKHRAESLVKQARKLAAQIERANSSPPLSFTGSLADLRDLQVGWSLPRNLRSYARYWENRLLWLSVRRDTDPRSDKITVALEYIRECTGKYHYREFADLLDFAGVPFRGRQSGSVWSESTLRQLQHRYRRRMKKLEKLCPLPRPGRIKSA
jgi:hypothetical protein